MRWLTSHPTYRIYKKNIYPGLTNGNSQKQVAFSQLVHDNWNLPRGKILWIMSDEKWMYGLAPRSTAKECAELGLEKQCYNAHHKNHIEKVMVHATVGYAFDGSPENGGDGLLIGLHRCQAHKVSTRDIRYSSKDPVTGRITFKGNPIKHEKNKPYLVVFPSFEHRAVKPFTPRRFS